MEDGMGKEGEKGDGVGLTSLIYFQKYLGPPTQFQRSHPSDSDHTQSQLSKSMGYGKHDISKSINIEDSIFCIE